MRKRHQKPPHNYCRLAQASTMQADVRRVSAVASTEEVDSYGTLLLASGWDLARYQANPVLLFAHDGSTRTPVGHCENVRVEGTELLFDAVFDNTSAFDEEVFAKYAKGVMRGFSVRFDPIEHRTETRNGKEVLVYTRQVLMEISCAPVPANAGALTRTDDPKAKQGRSMNRAEIMKALRALAEGEGEEAEQKAARALYEKMGGAAGELSAREALESGEAPATDEEPVPPSSKEDPKAERTANVALAKRTAELELNEERGKVEALVAKHEGCFTPHTRAWALKQPLDVVQSFVISAPNLQQRAPKTAPATRGEDQGEKPTLPSAEDEKLDRILGINKTTGQIGFAKPDNGVMYFRTAKPDDLAKIQAERKQQRRAV